MTAPTYQLVITDEAEQDIAEGYNWYNERANLGLEFMASLGQKNRTD
jgi:hypothetical protein